VWMDKRGGTAFAKPTRRLDPMHLHHRVQAAGHSGRVRRFCRGQVLKQASTMMSFVRAMIVDGYARRHSESRHVGRAHALLSQTPLDALPRPMPIV
jgi:hypothetical protein